MPVIKEVGSRSPAEKAGIRPGDNLRSINGHAVADVLDYRFHMAERRVRLGLTRDGGTPFSVLIEKEEYGDIGLEFESYLMDRPRRCKNRCVFCFIDQLPPGLRESLYFKDDDTRLSFLTGNYVTLTNVGEAEIERIIAQRISPVNISVHATDPALRTEMMGNPAAGGVMEILRRFARAGIGMNGQIVLCRGLNDGEQLERTVRDLASLHPAMASVSVVPVGLTKYREGLYPLEPFSPAEAGEVVSRLERISRKLLRGLGTRLVFPGDEFYLKAGLPIPPAGAYEGFPQLENGVGLVASMREEFERGLSALPEEPARPGEKRECSVATGTAAYPFIKGLVDALMKKCHNLTVHVYGVENDFFGPNVTVAGLLTGRDLEGRLKGRRLGRKLFLPRVMLRSEGDLFLDSMSPPELSERLGVPVDFIPCDGFALIEKLTKRE